MTGKRLLLLLFWLSTQTFGYVEVKTATGGEIWWPKSNQDIYLHFDNSSGIGQATLAAVVANSLSEWTSLGLGFDVSLHAASSEPAANRNDIYFTDGGGYFSGSAIAAVTQTAYREATGEIVEADIIINDQKIFTDDSDDRIFIGNVMTHELGHFFGLSHSEVKSATMFYVLMKDQYSIEKDDGAGVLGIYQQSSKGSISGKIIGGANSAVGIFGAHVVAISAKDGSAVSAVSDANGAFRIDGLDTASSYYLQVRPLTTVETISDYYSTVRNNFCDGGQDYKTSFFERCEDRYRGLPQEIVLSEQNPSINVGSVTIGCSLNSPTDYLTNLQFSLGLEKKAFVGYVVDQSDVGEVEIDLTGYMVQSANEYLLINLVTQGLFSPVKAKLEVFHEGNLIDTVESGSSTFLDLSSAVSLNDYGVGIYDLKVTIEEIITPGETYIGGNAFLDYFAEGTSYVDGYSYYFLSYSIGTKNGTDYLNGQSPATIYDNSTCFEGNNAYSIAAKVEEPIDYSNDDVDAGYSCGTIMPNGPSSGGPMSMGIGFLLVYFFWRIMIKFPWNRAGFIP